MMNDCGRIQVDQEELPSMFHLFVTLAVSCSKNRQFSLSKLRKKLS